MAIFSIATLFFGQLASATSNGVPIAPVFPISFIPGRTFHRFTLENQAPVLEPATDTEQDYDAASRNSNLQALVKERILLEQFYGMYPHFFRLPIY